MNPTQTPPPPPPSPMQSTPQSPTPTPTPPPPPPPSPMQSTPQLLTPTPTPTPPPPPPPSSTQLSSQSPTPPPSPTQSSSQSPPPTQRYRCRKNRIRNKISGKIRAISIDEADFQNNCETYNYLMDMQISELVELCKEHNFLYYKNLKKKYNVIYLMTQMNC